MSDANTSRSNYRRDIQGLRGIAVLMVVLFHTGLMFPGGFAGVDAFFVISGYVITGTLLNKFEAGTFTFRAFFLGRVRRLLPALTWMISICLVLNSVLGPISSRMMAERTAVAAVLWNANHYLMRITDYFEPVAERNPFLHTWSLSVEEQFYLFFPIVAFLLWRRYGRKKTTFAIAILGLLSLTIGLCLAQWTSFGNVPAKFNFFSATTRIWEFAVGAVIMLAAERSKSLAKVKPIGIIGFIGLMISALLLSENTPFPSYASLLPVASTGLLIIAGMRENYISRLMSADWLVKLGDLSYGWYLWHWPLIVFAAATWPGQPTWIIGSCIVSLLLAFLSKRAVEDPIRYNSKVNTARLLAICFTGPIAAWFIAIGLNNATTRIPNVRDVEMMEDEYQAIGCNEPPFEVEKCDWNKTAGARVVLLGDSNAQMMIPALHDPKLQIYHFTARTKSGCPILQIPQFRNQTILQPCVDWLAEVEDWLQRLPSSVILVSTASDRYINNPQISFKTDDKWIMTSDDKRSLLASELTKFKQRLSKHTIIEVPLIRKFYAQSHSGFTYVGARDCSSAMLGISPESCLPHNRHEESIYDELLCGHSFCSMYEDGVWLYLDGGHLSVKGAQRLTPYFDHVLREATLR